MFGIGGFELFLILLFGFLIFGPDKLPAMAKTLGKAIAKFRSAQEEMSGVLKGEMVFDKDAEDPFKNPLDALDDVAAKASKGATAAKKAASTATKKAGQAAKKSGSATAAAGAAAAAAAKVEQGGDAPAKPESFAERKARYDKERQAKKEAEAEKAKKEAEEERKAAAEARKAEAAAKRAEAEAKRKAEAAAKTVSEAADAAPAAPAADTPTAEKKEN